MKSLPERIMEHAEATPICPAALLHLGQRAAVGQALSRLARSGRLMRIRQGVYMRPIESRFGRCAPSTEKSLLALSELWGETIVSNGGGAANWLGLTTQNPVRSRCGGPIGPRLIGTRVCGQFRLGDEGEPGAPGAAVWPRIGDSRRGTYARGGVAIFTWLDQDVPFGQPPNVVEEGENDPEGPSRLFVPEGSPDG